VVVIPLDAGPLVQSSLTIVSDPEATRVKALLAKLRIVEEATDWVPSSSVFKPTKVSGVQVNLPVEEDHCRKLLVEQLVSPAP